MSDIRRTCRKCRKVFHVGSGDPRVYCMECLLAERDARLQAEGPTERIGNPDARPGGQPERHVHEPPHNFNTRLAAGLRIIHSYDDSYRDTDGA